MGSSRANPRAGKILQGRYRLRSILAEGGMGVVWQGERVGIERPVVVKFLQAVMSDRPGAVDRFEREARATARLNHPNCVQLIDFGLEEQQPYLVVEFVEGQTLAELLDHGPLDARRATLIMIQVLGGLVHAHDRSILHRDLKPANIMIIEVVGYDDFVKILDFGLAKIIDETDRKEVTVHGVALGTPGYMSPEQASGMPSDARADIYSSGAVLYHLLTGVKIFDGGNVHSILRKHREQTPAPPRRLRGPGSISSELDAVVSKAMHRDPARRFQTAMEMRRALEGTPEGRAERRTGRRAVITSGDDDGTRVGRASRPLQPVPARKGAAWPLVAGIALMTAAAGAAGSMFLRPGPREVQTLTVTSVRDLAPEIVSPTVQPVVVTTTPIAPTTQPIERPVVADAPENADDGADDDLHAPPEAPPHAGDTMPKDVRTIADVRAIVRRGETNRAIAGLLALRRRATTPRDQQAEIATLLGHLYFDHGWTDYGLREYRYALTLDVAARSDQTIIDNTVDALGDPAYAARARRVLIDSVGRTAIPALRHATEKPKLREQAESVLAKLGATSVTTPR